MRVLKNTLKVALSFVQNGIEWLDLKNPSLDQQLQKTMLTQYKAAVIDGKRLYSDIKDAGFRSYSEYEEDGILLYLLAVVGIENRTVVEMCCGTGRECMAANLVINHGFKGYLFDGDASNVAIARRFFGIKKECRAIAPTITKAWITRENVNNLLNQSGVAGEVDVLSLDMDGNDYYIWQAIESISPRICVFETQDIIPGNLDLTIPYSEEFYAWGKNEVDNEFRSVSLGAMNKLSMSKGYTLVGSHKHGFNVFFVRNDLLSNGLLESVSVDEVHDNEWTKQGQLVRWPLVSEHGWVEV